VSNKLSYNVYKADNMKLIVFKKLMEKIINIYLVRSIYSTFKY